MLTIVANAIRWVGRRLLWLVVIVVALLGAKLIRDEWRQLDQDVQSLQVLREAQVAVERFRDNATSALKERVPARDASLSRIEKDLHDFEAQLAQKNAERKALWDSSPIERILPTTRTFRRLVEMDIEIALAQQGLDHSRRLYDFSLGAIGTQAQLDQQQREVARLDQALQQNKFDQWRLSKDHPWMWQVPFADAYKRMKALESTQESLNKARADAKLRLAEKQVLLEQLRRRATAPQFAIDSKSIDGLIQPLRVEIGTVEKLLEGSKFRQAIRPVLDILPVALAVLVGVVLSPLLVKTLAYYVIAPLAARRPGIRLLPGEAGTVIGGVGLSGAESVQARTSDVSLSLPLGEGNRLLILPEFLQASSLRAKKDTKWLLDWSIPLTSLAAGMYGLIRVEPDGLEPITISSNTDPLAEFSLIQVPADSAIVLQPRCLVGLVQIGDAPTPITRHWRLASLSAWLTLQLRYIVFHGPARLIVKGCRGVRVESVTAGRTVNQAATLGFSANLSYSVARNETFPSYLSGQRDLFQDCWSGEHGYCIYAETPNATARGGVLGRGIKGILDAFLKAFGL